MYAVFISPRTTYFVTEISVDGLELRISPPRPLKFSDGPSRASYSPPSRVSIVPRRCISYLLQEPSTLSPQLVPVRLANISNALS